MILDKKREVFRLVPIQKHLYFEQQKTLVPKVAQQQPVAPEAPAKRPESASDFDFANVNKKKEVTAPKKSGKKALQAIFRNKAFVIGQRLPAKNQGNQKVKNIKMLDDPVGSEAERESDEEHEETVDNLFKPDDQEAIIDEDGNTLKNNERASLNTLLNLDKLQNIPSEQTKKGRGRPKGANKNSQGQKQMSQEQLQQLASQIVEKYEDFDSEKGEDDDDSQIIAGMSEDDDLENEIEQLGKKRTFAQTRAPEENDTKNKKAKR